MHTRESSDRRHEVVVCPWAFSTTVHLQNLSIILCLCIAMAFGDDSNLASSLHESQRIPTVPLARMYIATDLYLMTPRPLMFHCQIVGNVSI